MTARANQDLPPLSEEDYHHLRTLVLSDEAEMDSSARQRIEDAFDNRAWVDIIDIVCHGVRQDRRATFRMLDRIIQSSNERDAVIDAMLSRWDRVAIAFMPIWFLPYAEASVSVVMNCRELNTTTVDAILKPADSFCIGYIAAALAHRGWALDDAAFARLESAALGSDPAFSKQWLVTNQALLAQEALRLQQRLAVDRPDHDGAGVVVGGL